MVSNIVYVHPYLGKIPILTNIFQRGWNHQPELVSVLRKHVNPKTHWTKKEKKRSIRTMTGLGTWMRSRCMVRLKARNCISLVVLTDRHGFSHTSPWSKQEKLFIMQSDGTVAPLVICCGWNVMPSPGQNDRKTYDRAWRHGRKLRPREKRSKA